jgi:predicted transcriptional regulator
MNVAVHNPKKAIELRRTGLSYADIAKQLKVSRSAVCVWVKNLRLTETEKAQLQKNLKAKIERGRMRASITIRSRKVFKEKTIYEEVERGFEKKSKDPLFMFGMGLWGTLPMRKGGFSLQFTTSNSEIMNIMTIWVEKYLDIPKKSLKFRNYKGSKAIIITKVDYIRKIIAWQKLIMRYHS